VNIGIVPWRCAGNGFRPAARAVGEHRLAGFPGRRTVGQHRLAPFRRRPQFRLAADGWRRLRRSGAEQDIVVPGLEERLGQLAMTVCLPLVVAQNAGHRCRAQANQSHLEFGHLSRIPHLQGFFDIHFDHARNAGFLHGDADQLLGHFHRDFIMGNKQELRVAPTFS
jgi:hypothetical protein